MTASLFFLSILQLITFICIYNFILYHNLRMSLPLVFWLEDWAVLLSGWDIADSQISRRRPGWLSPPHRQGGILFRNSAEAVSLKPNTFGNLILVRQFHPLFCSVRWVHRCLVLHLPHLNGGCINNTLASHHSGPSVWHQQRGHVGNQRRQEVKKEVVWVLPALGLYLSFVVPPPTSSPH